MGETPDVSVVISTYNRCKLLPAALDSILAQDSRGVNFEVVVVDNNSNDRTRQVAESYVARDPRVRYLFEGRQGLSHGWNTGIAAARAPLIALADDDICVAPDWVAEIKRAFDEHPEVDFIGSRVLPRWPHEPPRWLTREHWAPLALQDAAAPFRSDSEQRLCLLGKSFRREVFERHGLFRPELGRVKDGVGSTEDSDMQRRLWAAGRQGLHAPSVVTFTDVPAERMTKEYYRRWHTGHGRFYAVMRAEELECSRARLFDVPAHLYRQAAADALSWLARYLRGQADKAFLYETRLRFFVGFYTRRREQFRADGRGGTARELARFARELARAGGRVRKGVA